MFWFEIEKMVSITLLAFCVKSIVHKIELKWKDVGNMLCAHEKFENRVGFQGLKNDQNLIKTEVQYLIF